jgi:hypothetical protein
MKTLTLLAVAAAFAFCGPIANAVEVVVETGPGWHHHHHDELINESRYFEHHHHVLVIRRTFRRWDGSTYVTVTKQDV